MEQSTVQRRHAHTQAEGHLAPAGAGLVVGQGGQEDREDCEDWEDWEDDWEDDWGRVHLRG